MTVYHFTPFGHVGNILFDGFIKAHTDRERPDPFVWFTQSQYGDKDAKHQQFPLARLTMRESFPAVKFNRGEHWEKHQTLEYIQVMEKGIKLLGYVESDWFVHEGNVAKEHIAKIHIKKTRNSPWEEINAEVLERRENPHGTLFQVNGSVFAMVNHGINNETKKRGWLFVQVFNYKTPNERYGAFDKSGALVFLPE